MLLELSGMALPLSGTTAEDCIAVDGTLAELLVAWVFLPRTAARTFSTTGGKEPVRDLT